LRDWALAQISPGINLLKLTVLVGKQLKGWPGLLAATGGLLFPSALVTALMTAGFSVIRSQPLVQAALKGVLPATIGLSLAMGFQMGSPLLTKAYKEGGLRLGIHVLILGGAALLFAFNVLSPVIVLVLAGAVTVPAMAIVPVRKRPVEPGPQ
jgi:chromate transporter